VSETLQFIEARAGQTRQGVRLCKLCGGVSNFAQTCTANESIFQAPSHYLKAAPHRKMFGCNGEVPWTMRDARGYAAECLSAAKTCQPGYRSIATSWDSLACQEEAIDALRASWTPTQISGTRSEYGRERQAEQSASDGVYVSA
jgi:hypothetical protein